jgi:hypothetical protein
MSWRHVFDCKVRYQYPGDAAKKAAECGYKFFAWDDVVFFVLPGEGEYANTGIKVSELTA